MSDETGRLLFAQRSVTFTLWLPSCPKIVFDVTQIACCSSALSVTDGRLLLLSLLQTRCAPTALTPPRLLHCRRQGACSVGEQRHGALCRVRVYRKAAYAYNNVNRSGKVIVQIYIRIQINTKT